MGAAIVQASMRDIPNGYDYRPLALVALCRQRYVGNDSNSKDRGPPAAEVLASIRSTVEKMKKPTSTRAWAHKILDRVQRGERVPMLAEQAARAAAASGPAIREPGQEG